MASLSYVNLYEDDDVAALAYIAGWADAANPLPLGAATEGEPSVIFINQCTAIRFGLALYGDLSARVTGVIWP